MSFTYAGKIENCQECGAKATVVLKTFPTGVIQKVVACTMCTHVYIDELHPAPNEWKPPELSVWEKRVQSVMSDGGEDMYDW